MVPSQEPAANALPFRAGVLTQRAGHFAQVIQHGSPQSAFIGIVHKATDVGPWMCQNKPVRECLRDAKKSNMPWATLNLISSVSVCISIKVPTYDIKM